MFRILEESGVGIPKYYEWRSRSGCYFCFFQRNIEWVGLQKRHPELYEEAKKYEKEGPDGEPGFTWSAGESLVQLEDPKRVQEIETRHADAMRRETARSANRRLVDVFEEVLDDEDDEQPCLICTL